MSTSSDLRKLAEELDDEHCIDFPVKWVADRLRAIADRDEQSNPHRRQA